MSKQNRRDAQRSKPKASAHDVENRAHSTRPGNGAEKRRASTNAGAKHPKRRSAAATRAHAALPPRSAFLPVSRADMEARGWDQCDFVYICGDAYVDHPSFGMAIITRILEAHGYKVGVICQPDWRDPASIAALGEPRLAFLVSSGNMDSMVNHYSVAKHRRRTDAYTPGGQAGARPDHAVSVYGNLIRRTFKNTPIVLGGIEASLRRLAHYDYWQDKLKRSVLLDSGADLLVYGMGEHAIVEVADALDAGLPVDQITYVAGTAYRARSLDEVYDAVVLPSWDELEADRLAYARSFNVQYENSDPISGKRLVEPYPHSVYAVQNPPAAPLTTPEMDAVYALPYTRAYHPDYEAAGGVPALKEVKMSLISNRGCFGECSSHVPPGPHRADAQPRVAYPRGRGHHTRPRVQRLHPRRGRPHGKLPPARLQRPAQTRCLRKEALPMARGLPSDEREPPRLRVAAAQASRAPRRQEGLRAQRHSL